MLVTNLKKALAIFVFMQLLAGNIKAGGGCGFGLVNQDENSQDKVAEVPLHIYSNNVEKLKEEIRRVNASSDKSAPVYLVTVTRKSRKGNKWCKAPIMKDENKVKEILNDIKKRINEKCSSGYKIITFSEMFFSQKQALEEKDGVSYDVVLKHIKEFSKNVPNSIIFYNVLYKKKEESSISKLLYLYALTLLREKQGGITIEDKTNLNASLPDKLKKIIDDSMVEKYINNVEKYVGTYIANQQDIESANTFSFEDFWESLGKNQRDNKIEAVDFLKNETICVREEKPIFTYRKSTYFQEEDKLIRRNYLYDLGDGYPIQSNEKDSTVLLNSISTEICLDHQLGVRKNNKWRSKRNEDAESSKLHIIQSNSIVIDLSSLGNLPANIPVLYSDSERHFSNYGVVSGGMVCSLEQTDNKLNLTLGKEQVNLHNDVERIDLNTEEGNNAEDVKDFYTILVHKI